MKKIILSSIFAIALLATAGWGVNKSMQNDANLSDLALANVEALADIESDPGRTLVSCTHANLTGNPNDGSFMMVCTGCVYKMAKDPGNTSECYIYH